HAERMNVGMAPFGREQRLAPNATNLPEVLNSLQHVKVRFHRYTQLVRRVLPQVANVSVRPHPELDGQLEILVWSGDPDSEREDLAIPLLESGTGVSQVLAMLYVVLTADTRRTIAIDEPTCFLHPGAVRALLEVFREYPQHQYILATHSPSVIAAANPGRLYLLENDGNQARVVSIDPQKALDQRRTLDAVGADLGDVLGPERILWLEGKTEERCFPLIARRLCKIDLAKTAMLGVVATGDFDLKRDKRRVQLSADVYQRLSSGIGLIPPAVGFVFDREDLTDEQCARLREKVPAPVHFLPRKLYENYLLHPKAVAALLGQFAIDEARVREWIEANRSKLGGKGPDWRHKVDGAKLLKNMFTELSESQLAYDKVSHGQELTEWLLAEDPSHLQEVADLIVTALEARAA
ncbi:MAG: AAA family ATPase, partial [Myxococcales bacterium]|nr:AAA family ATPase [Myxococcales bacterium]